jgi:sodium-dependent dicarboxylate transporter 2/3/5
MALTVRRVGLFGAPVLGLLCYFLLPDRYSAGADQWVDFTPAGRATLALMVWMAGWWLTEAVDIEATALLPIVAFPLLGIADLGKVLPPYAADVIFLFMGGFVLGLAIERWGPTVASPTPSSAWSGHVRQRSSGGSWRSPRF